MLGPLILAATLSLDPQAANRFANLALACVHKEYPNKIAHVLNSDQDVAPPRDLGGHWLGSFATYLVTKRGIR